MGRTSPSSRTDLLIGITLAELFLLVLFIVWYTQGAGMGGNWQKLAEERRLKLIEREAKIAQLEASLKRSEELRRWWQQNYGIDPPANANELQDFLTGPAAAILRADIGRGYRRCSEQNLIIAAKVVDGNISVEVVGKAEPLSSGTAPRIPPIGTRLTDSGSVTDLLSSIRSYYQQVESNGKPCRFDYRLAYGSKEDYFDGRQLFESLMYPAGVVSVKAGPLRTASP